MASESIMSFEASSSVEFEDMEMTELDADTLMKLLEEEPAVAGGGEEQEDGGGCVVQPPGWTGNESGGGGSHSEEEEVVGNELEWLLDVTEMPPAPPCSEEVGGEMLGMGEYGLDYYYYYNNNNNYNNNNAAFLVEETVFEEGLWQNSY